MKRALTSFAYGNRVVAASTELEDDDPVAVARPSLFEDVDGEPRKAAPRKRAPRKPKA